MKSSDWKELFEMVKETADLAGNSDTRAIFMDFSYFLMKKVVDTKKQEEAEEAAEAAHDEVLENIANEPA